MHVELFEVVFKCFDVVMFKVDHLSVDISRSSPIIKRSLAPPLQALMRATPTFQHPINNCQVRDEVEDSNAEEIRVLIRSNKRT